MKIYLTGSTGLLGQAILEFCELNGILCDQLDRRHIRAKNLPRLCELIESYDVIIHAAANTNVEECEVNPFDCYRDNTLLTEILFSASNKCGLKMVFISSTGVYGNYQDIPYHEYNCVKPTTTHHHSKVLSENIVLRAPSSLVVRTGWIFGGAVENRKNFVARRVEEAKASDGFIYSNADQFGSPTYARDLAEHILKLVCSEQVGVFNCVNEGHASRFEFVSEIIANLGIAVNVLPVDSASFNRCAKVSNNEMAINLKMQQCGFNDMPVWKDSLKLYMNRILNL